MGRRLSCGRVRPEKHPNAAFESRVRDGFDGEFKPAFGSLAAMATAASVSDLRAVSKWETVQLALERTGEPISRNPL